MSITKETYMASIGMIRRMAERAGTDTKKGKALLKKAREIETVLKRTRENVKKALEKARSDPAFSPNTASALTEIFLKVLTEELER